MKLPPIHATLPSVRVRLTTDSYPLFSGQEHDAKRIHGGMIGVFCEPDSDDADFLLVVFSPSDVEVLS